MARSRKVLIPYAPRPAFAAFHGREQRWACIVAHRRAGKTVAAVNDLIRAALTCERPEPRFAYVWSCLGTFGGATLTLQTLGPDGVTEVTIDTMTSAAQKGEVVGANATVRVLVSGGTPSALYCTLS